MCADLGAYIGPEVYTLFSLVDLFQNFLGFNATFYHIPKTRHCNLLTPISHRVSRAHQGDHIEITLGITVLNDIRMENSKLLELLVYTRLN